ncbi:hypothetical protein [Actinomadura luteofluorescens]|uniref:hypothetical protein n=1 Tax=Actinomadura luteofluorescens TaxID=46163 RepID=UPI0036721483
MSEASKKQSEEPQVLVLGPNGITMEGGGDGESEGKSVTEMVEQRRRSCGSAG